MDAALIPQINALLAVGLVSLPGMMTGRSSVEFLTSFSASVELKQGILWSEMTRSHSPSRSAVRMVSAVSTRL